MFLINITAGANAVTISIIAVIAWFIVNNMDVVELFKRRSDRLCGRFFYCFGYIRENKGSTNRIVPDISFYFRKATFNGILSRLSNRHLIILCFC